MPTPSTILLVDDQDANLYVMCHLLAEMNCHLETASSGREAIDKVKKTQFELAIIDIRMPEIDGFETAREIHKIYPYLPVIFVTAEPKDEEKTRKAFNEGAIDILFKPLDAVLLHDKIEALLRLSRKRQELRENEVDYDFANETLTTLLNTLSVEFNMSIDELMREFDELDHFVSEKDNHVDPAISESVKKCMASVSRLIRTQHEVNICVSLIRGGEN